MSASASVLNRARTMMEAVSAIISSPMSTTVPDAASPAQRCSSFAASANMTSAKAFTPLGVKKGAMSLRWRRHRSPVLAMRPSPAM